MIATSLGRIRALGADNALIRRTGVPRIEDSIVSLNGAIKGVNSLVSAALSAV